MVILSSTSIEEVTTENHPVYEKNKMISKQFNDIRSSIRKKNTNKKIKEVLLTVISNGTITLRRKVT